MVLVEDEGIAATFNENRHFMKVEISGEDYVTLYDPGLQITIKGPRIAERFEGRIEGSSSYIKAPLTSNPLTKTMSYCKQLSVANGPTSHSHIHRYETRSFTRAAARKAT